MSEVVAQSAVGPESAVPAETLGSSARAAWRRVPLYARIIAALVAGVVTGLAAGPRAAGFAILAQLTLRLLTSLVAPLILLATVRAISSAAVNGRTASRLVATVLSNTAVAAAAGLLAANLLRPGQWTHRLPAAAVTRPTALPGPLAALLDSVPRSVAGPFGDGGSILGVVILALAFGVALRGLRLRPLRTVDDAVDAGLDAVTTVLGWILQLVPLAVFGGVAATVGQQGGSAFAGLFGLLAAVALGGALLLAYYLLRVRLGCGVGPHRFLGGLRDAIWMAFSTASSVATMPVTYGNLQERVGISKESAGLGALVAANVNKDGAVLYQVTAALFVAQLIGRPLGLVQQLTVVAVAAVASLGAAGIPNASMVTITAVFAAVGLPAPFIAMLFSIDWLLDRVRTVMNVLGHATTACIIEGRRY